MNQRFVLFLLFGLISSQCSQNDPLCAECVNNVCRRCNGGFLQANGVCAAPVVVVDNCATYANQTVCKECALGYKLNPVTSMC